MEGAVSHQPAAFEVWSQVQ